METRERQDPRGLHTPKVRETAGSREKQETPPPPALQTTPPYLGMNLTQPESCLEVLPSLAGAPSGPRGAARAAAASLPPLSSCRTRGRPHQAAAGAGPRGPQPRRGPPRRAPRKPRANSWKVMAPSRSASRAGTRPRRQPAAAQLRAQRAELLTLQALERQFASQAAKTERGRASPPGPHPPPSRPRGLRGAWPTSAAATVGVRGHPLPLGAEASWAKVGQVRPLARTSGRAKRLSGSAGPTRLRAQTCTGSASPRAVRAHLWPPPPPQQRLPRLESLACRTHCPEAPGSAQPGEERPAPVPTLSRAGLWSWVWGF